ncbi:major facilitator superfamily domain-containing protein [Dipodascopsis uninucleata]
MQQDLSLYGNELSLFSTFFSIGYFLGSVPSQVLISHVRPSIAIPTIEIVWSGVTIATSACQSAKTIYIVRLIMGILEASIFPTFSHIIGSWYMPQELGKRFSMFYMAQPLANMFSGYIQAGVYTSMNGLGGLAGWRWLFIIDGVVSLPVALYGYFALPDYPHTCRSLYLGPKELAIANVRMKLVGRKPSEKMTWRRFLKMWKSWRPYVFLTVYNLDLLTQYYSYFNLWLEYIGYSVQERNIIPTGGYATSLVSGYVLGSISDFIGMRWPGWIFATSCKFVGSTILAVWDVGFHTKMFGFMIGFVGLAGFPLMLTWASEAFQDDPFARGVLIGWGNTINMIFSFWWAVVVYPSKDAPFYPVGYKLISPMAGLELIGIGIFYYMIKREVSSKGLTFNEFGLAVDRDDILESGDHELVAESVSSVQKNNVISVNVVAEKREY